MRKLILLFLLIACGTSGFLFPETDYKMETKLLVRENETYTHSIISNNGQIDISGKIKGSVFMARGNLVLNGTVEDDVICFASTVKLGPNAVIKKDLFLIGGTLNKDKSTSVKGEFIHFHFDDLKQIENTFLPFLADSNTVSFLKAMKLVLWFIITLIVLAIIPRKIYNTQEMFEDNIRKVGAVGLLSILSAGMLGVIFLLLCFVVIGVPLIILLTLFILTAFILGRTVMFYHIGLTFSNRFHYYHVPPAVYIMEGVIFYAIISAIPYAGPIFMIILNIFEMGVGVSMILRKKLRLK